MATDNPLNYVNYDYDDLKLQLINRLKADGAWLDTYESSTGNMIIEFYAAIANFLMFYLNRRAEEGYIGTAQNRSSILNLVKLINYSPKRSVSATGTLIFTIAAISSAIVYIPRWTECQTSDGIKYVTSRDASIISPQVSVSAEGIQGQKIDAAYSSDGSTDQSFSIDDTFVENTNYEVFVDGIEWTEITTFLSSVSSSEHFRVEHELDDTLTLHFGNNIRGKIPESGAEIIFRYVRSDGLDGNVYQIDLIDTLNNVIYDTEGERVATIVTNSTSFTGGDDAEDKETVRVEAPQVFQTGDRAVTRTDHKWILRNYPSIADANAWGENEENAPNYDMFNTANLCIVLQNWEHPTDSFKTTLGLYLKLKASLTIKYEFVQADILLVIPELDVLVNRGFSLSATQSEIENTLDEAFTLGSTAKLGVSKKHSNICAAIDNLDGVNYHHVTLLVRKPLVAGYESNYDHGEVLDALPVLENSLKVYATIDEVDTLVATDDGVGGITDVVSGYDVTGDIDYATGAVNINFNPDEGISAVYVTYQQDSEGDIDVEEDQICKLYDVSYNSIAYISE